MPAPATQKAVVLHEYPLWRDALKGIVESLDYRVVGATASADEALRLIDRESPHLFVVGLSRNQGRAIEVVRRARSEHMHLKAVVLSAAFDQGEAAEAVAAGAFAYIVETTHPEDIRAAIRQGAQASVFLGSGEAAVEIPERAAARRAHEPLTKRELEILRLVSEGSSNAHVARKLWVTEQTVKFHLSNIYRKLGVGNRTEAARWAQLTGLLENPNPPVEQLGSG